MPRHGGLFNTLNTKTLERQWYTSSEQGLATPLEQVEVVKLMKKIHRRAFATKGHVEWNTFKDYFEEACCTACPVYDNSTACHVLAKNGVVVFSNDGTWEIKQFKDLNEIFVVDEKCLHQLEDWPSTDDKEILKEDIEHVESIFKAIVQDEEERDDLKTVFRLIITREQTGHKLLMIFTGPSNCLKSTLARAMFKMLLPSETKDLDNSMLHQNKQNTGAKLNREQLKLYRAVLFDELSPDKISKERLKKTVDEQQTFVALATSNQETEWKQLAMSDDVLPARLAFIHFKPLLSTEDGESETDYLDRCRQEAAKHAKFLESERGKKALRFVISSWVPQKDISRFSGQVAIEKTKMFQVYNQWFQKYLEKREDIPQLRWCPLTCLKKHMKEDNVLTGNLAPFLVWLGNTHGIHKNRVNQDRLGGCICRICGGK
eukprot:TRINITY_DN14912_c0_g1_i1.p1 TRINITY_DN14912_c0_g1~~TRINITY_DN14912_c0_g1_i1.p1  ORF type:complete len:431 (+),score=98.16 TRINITY_DN14912_c0_g1_i1:202-1494(+)